MPLQINKSVAVISSTYIYCHGERVLSVKTHHTTKHEGDIHIKTGQNLRTEYLLDTDSAVLLNSIF
jgi:hypothetical protein